MTGIIVTIIIIIVIIVVVMWMLKPVDDRFGIVDLITHPSEIYRNHVQGTPALRIANRAVSIAPCDMPCDGWIVPCPSCPFVGPPFTTQCGGSCEATYGNNWKSIGIIGDPLVPVGRFCPIGSTKTRQVCKRI